MTKANEAPEKIHIQPNAHDGWFEGKIPNGLPNGLFVEYTRTDAFIEKACEWLDDNLHHYWGSISADPHNFLFDFRKAMSNETE